MEQNREPRNGPTNLWPTIFDKAGKNTQWKKDSIFSKWCWEKWTATCRMNLDHFLTPYTKSKFKMDERPKCETGNHQNLEENTGSNLSDLSCSNFLLDTLPEERETKRKMNY